MTKLVAWRRGHRAPAGGSLISPFTVNDTTEQLKKLFTRAKLWGVRFEHEPQWKHHWLAEPQERVRELVGDEGERLEAATRDDYAPFFAFARASGLRLERMLCCDGRRSIGAARQISKLGKGGKLVTVPITSDDPRNSLAAARASSRTSCSPMSPSAPATAACRASAIPSPIPASRPHGGGCASALA